MKMRTPFCDKPFVPGKYPVDGIVWTVDGDRDRFDRFMWGSPGDQIAKATINGVKVVVGNVSASFDGARLDIANERLDGEGMLVDLDSIEDDYVRDIVRSGMVALTQAAELGGAQVLDAKQRAEAEAEAKKLADEQRKESDLNDALRRLRG